MQKKIKQTALNLVIMPLLVIFLGVGIGSMLRGDSFFVSLHAIWFTIVYVLLPLCGAFVLSWAIEYGFIEPTADLLASALEENAKKKGRICLWYSKGQ